MEIPVKIWKSSLSMTVAKSSEIIDFYAKKDKRIISVKNRIGGVSGARNLGLQIAKGEWIAFVDSDDWLSENFFEILLKYAEKTQCNVVSCKCEKVRSRPSSCEAEVEKAEKEKAKEVKVEGENEFESAVKIGVDAGVFLSSRGRGYVHSGLYARALIKGISFDQNVRFMEDRLFNLTILACKSEVLRCCCVNQPLYCYWQNPDGSLKILQENTDWSVPLIESIIALLTDMQNNAVRKAISESFVKAVFSYRYGTMFNVTDERTENLKRYKGLALTYMRAMPLRSKGLFRAFLEFPWLYRLFRISNDRTLLN